MIKPVLVDPPWEMCSGGSKGLSAQAHYPTQKQHQIIDTCLAWMEQHPVAPEAHLYLWTMNAFPKVNSKGVMDALELCREMGFEPIQFIPWIKNSGNPTLYALRCTELCLFATRFRKGHIYDVAYARETETSVCKKGLTTTKDYIIADRGRHSKKPEIFYDYIEERSNGPYLEMYARNQREGWVSVGNQVDNSVSFRKNGHKQLDFF